MKIVLKDYLNYLWKMDLIFKFPSIKFIYQANDMEKNQNIFV